MVESFLEAEASVQERLEPEFHRHIDLAIDALNLLADVANAAIPILPDAPTSTHVGLALLIRISNDLRCSFLLAERGYPLQAASLVASMHEAAYTAAYIGNDEARAQEWSGLLHPTKPFRPVTVLTREGVAKLGMPNPETEANRAYKQYSQLCWAKHIAPFAERTIYQDVGQGRVYGIAGPSTTEGGVRGTWFALEKAVWYAYITIRSVINFHLSKEVGNTLDGRIERLMEEYKALQAAFLTRWPNEDPFPGRWKDVSRSTKRIGPVP